jgi:fatty acid synthase, animal type
LTSQILSRLFINGVDFDIAKLYPPINFPVSRGTPMISPNLKWNHDANQFVPTFDPVTHYSRRNMVINLSDKNFEFMQGHKIGDRVIFPAAGWIYYVWESFALMLGKPMESLKVEIHDINFLQSAELSANHDVNITIAINVGKRKFTKLRNV